ncbi:MAG TPA: fluoride efflux transporter CrcB [Intrasporangium sp.]|uniref:fluoride efflux transporter CrcB n=1 Tax=Intrasporangium sp. TaxID=1925024 RepID=UPI002D7A3CF8|nr:fluoride efflux transporter CrcB [Intrasporangium sp.]HET7398192.1 fluoride efflux transporter CrcB [Intrasporangium sp.]
MSLLLVVAGAMVGAPLRYLTDRVISARHDSVFPWGTLAVNVTGSFILGLLVGSPAAASPSTRLLVGTGFCGALTTYSTFSWETLRLLEDDARLLAAANVAGSLVAGVGAAALGTALGRTLWP